MTVGFFDWLFGRRKLEGRDQDLSSELAHWRIAKIKGDDGTVVVARIRIRRPDLPDLHKYTTAVSISWPIVDDILSAELTMAMKQFEVWMEDFESVSYLIQVRTGLGERNWLYYSSDGGALTTAIRARLAANGWPLTVETREDPTWAEWRVLAERIGETTILH